MSTFLKTIGVLLLFGILFAGGYLIYTYLFAGTIYPPELAGGGVVSHSGAVTKTQPLIKPVSEQPIRDYWINTKTNAVFLATPEGNIVRTFGDGRDEAVSRQTLPGLQRVDPSPDGARAIAAFGYPLAPTFAVFDAETRSWERLPAGTLMATFDPTGQTIAYLREENGLSSLFTFRLSDKKITLVLRVAASDGILQWKKPREIWIVPRPTAFAQSDLLVIDLDKNQVHLARSGAMDEWSADGALMLRFIPANGSAPTLTLTQTVGEAVLPFATLPSKCGFTSAAVYCAVPFEFPSRYILPDDYLKERVFTRDEIVRYDIAERRSAVLFGIADGLIDADHLSLSGKRLLFRNRYDEKLYAVELPTEKK